MKEKENIISEKSFDFALQIIKLYSLLKSQNEFVLSRQLLKSGTSIGANVEEAGAAQTYNDFIAKMSIASKEARETIYWLKLLEKSQLVKANFQTYISSAEEIINILSAIVKTAQTKQQRPKIQHS